MISLSQLGLPPTLYLPLLSNDITMTVRGRINAFVRAGPT